MVDIGAKPCGEPYKIRTRRKVPAHFKIEVETLLRPARTLPTKIKIHTTITQKSRGRTVLKNRQVFRRWNIGVRIPTNGHMQVTCSKYRLKLFSKFRSRCWLCIATYARAGLAAAAVVLTYFVFEYNIILYDDVRCQNRINPRKIKFRFTSWYYHVLNRYDVRKTLRLTSPTTKIVL